MEVPRTSFRNVICPVCSATAGPMWPSASTAVPAPSATNPLPGNADSTSCLLGLNHRTSTTPSYGSLVKWFDAGAPKVSLMLEGATAPPPLISIRTVVPGKT